MKYREPYAAWRLPQHLPSALPAAPAACRPYFTFRLTAAAALSFTLRLVAGRACWPHTFTITIATFTSINL